MPKTKTFAILLFAIFLIGCTGATKSGNQVATLTGTDGITAEFLPNAPAKTVFENAYFPVAIRLRNLGTYSVPDDPDLRGYISIGREKDYVRTIEVETNSRISKSSAIGRENEIFFFLDGRSQINPNGDELVASVKAKTSSLDPQSEHRLSTITASICYPYKTALSTTVCIDPDLAGLRPGKKVCKVSDQAFSGGQGAPLAITKVESLMLPDVDNNFIKPQFIIYIENKGRGNPVNLIGFRNACGNDLETADKYLKIPNRWNVAWLRAYTSDSSGKVPLSCCPNEIGQCPEKPGSITDINQLSGYIKLRDNKDFVRCTFINGIPKTFDAYTSPLSIEIGYGYMQTISTNFVIQRPLKY